VPAPPIIGFKDALAQATESRNLLLGNGFSIACKRDIFSYRALLQEANFKENCPLASKAFSVFKTADFEAVIQKLEDAAIILAIYKSIDKKTRSKIKKDAECIRENLVKTLTAKHPNLPSDITDAQYVNCRAFLANFSYKYTLNYDLLLYWALMHDEVDSLEIECNDGFTRTDDVPQDYVVWDEASHEQNVFYLHGALHLFDAGCEIQKYTWSNTGVKLIDQIRAALGRKMFPVFVAEGTHVDKAKKILHNSYLGRCFRGFEKTKKDLFVFGHSLSESDEHIVKAIEKSHVKKIFISVHGDLSSTTNKRLFARAAQMQVVRQDGRYPLEIIYYDADSAKVWG